MEGKRSRGKQREKMTNGLVKYVVLLPENICHEIHYKSYNFAENFPQNVAVHKGNFYPKK